MMICPSADTCATLNCPYAKPHEKDWLCTSGCKYDGQLHAPCIPYKPESDTEQDDYTKALSLATLLASSLRPNKDGLYETTIGGKTLVGVYKLICVEVNKQKGE